MSLRPPERGLYVKKDASAIGPAFASPTGGMLEHIEVGVRHLVGGAFIANATLSECVNHVVNGLVYELTSYIQAERLAKKKQDFLVAWPKSRWQMWKLHHPGRFTRRFPVRYLRATVTIDIESLAMFPESNLVLQDLGKPIYVQQVYRSLTYDN